MSRKNDFNVITEKGWRRGFNNIFRAELGSWFGVKEFLIHCLIWVGLVNGMITMQLLSFPDVEIEGILAIYSIFTGLFPPIGIIIIMSESLVGEKRSGTASWILSKPISRSSFILAKWLASSVGILVTAILIPGIIAYLELSLFSGQWLSFLPFLGGVAVLGLNILFYLSFTLMLGAFSNNIGPVIAIPMVFNFFHQYLGLLGPIASQLIPWTLIMGAGDIGNAISVSIILGEPIYSVVPIIVVSGYVIIFVALTIWRFGREEL